jgi:hypothetical protein
VSETCQNHTALSIAMFIISVFMVQFGLMLRFEQERNRRWPLDLMIGFGCLNLLMYWIPWAVRMIID